MIALTLNIKGYQNLFSDVNSYEYSAVIREANIRC